MAELERTRRLRARPGCVLGRRLRRRRWLEREWDEAHGGSAARAARALQPRRGRRRRPARRRLSGRSSQVHVGLEDGSERERRDAERHDREHVSGGRARACGPAGRGRARASRRRARQGHAAAPRAASEFRTRRSSLRRRSGSPRSPRQEYLAEPARGRRHACGLVGAPRPLRGLGDQEQPADRGERAKVVEEDARRDVRSRWDPGEREREPSASLGCDPTSTTTAIRPHASVNAVARALASQTVSNSEGTPGETRGAACSSDGGPGSALRGATLALGRASLVATLAEGCSPRLKLIPIR